VAIAALVWAGAIAAAVRSEFRRNSDNLSRAKPLPGRVCPGLVVGVDSNAGLTNKPPSPDSTFAAIHKDLGAQVVRVTLRWDQVEPVKGEQNWSGMDGIVANLRAAGIEPSMVVVGSPSWANGVPASKPNHYLYVPARGAPLNAWLENYSAFLAAAVKRYDRFVRRWQIWNGPNVAANWRPRPDPAAYGPVYLRLRSTIMSREPTAEVAVGGLGELTLAHPPDLSGIAFLRALIRARIPLGDVAIQPIATNDNPPDVHVAGQNNFDDIDKVHKLLSGNGVPASLWVTGWGWSSKTVGPQRQAQYVDRAFTLLENRYPFVRFAAYSTDRDTPPGLLQGLLNGILRPKPAAAVFRAHADLAAARCSTALGG
jgi:hypothetical protein